MIRTTFLTGAALLCAIALTFKAVPANAGMGSDLAEQINSMPAGTSTPSAANPDVTSPVQKFSANGRLAESLTSGGCANNPLTASCGSSCDALTLNGPVTGTLGATPEKFTMDVCFTLEPSSSSGISLGNGLGLGTLTNAKGDVVKLAVAGALDINDEITTSPVTLFLSENLTYLVEGGTGPFATEQGAGNMAVSTIFVNPVSIPISGAGQVAMTGSLSKN